MSQNIDITFSVPDAIINANGIELYAIGYGWDSSMEMSSLDYAKGIVKSWLIADFSRVYKSTKAREDRVLREMEVESLLSEIL